jgi:hypothetical protein
MVCIYHFEVSAPLICLVHRKELGIITSSQSIAIVFAGIGRFANMDVGYLGLDFRKFRKIRKRFRTYGRLAKVD